MLEDVAHLRGHAPAKHQLRRDQLVQRLVQLFGARHDRRQELVGKLAADDRCDLGDFLGRGEAIETRHQRVLKRRRNRGGRQRTIDLVAIVLLAKETRFEHGSSSAPRRTAAMPSAFAAI